jgi:hypothetical protein
MSPTSPYAIQSPLVYDELQFLNNLPAYNTSPGNDEMLDLYRMLQQSGGYYFQGLSFPNGADTVIGGDLTLNGTLIVPAGTYITGITQYYSVQEDERGAAAIGFKMKVFDKGTKESIFYLDYCIDGLVGRDMTQDVNPYGGVKPMGPGLLMSPFIITDPGQIGWEVVNLSSHPATLQVLLTCAVPVNAKNIGQQIVSRG